MSVSKWRATVVASVAACASLAAGESFAQSLSTLVEQALATEPGLLAARSEVAAAEARYDQRAGALWPQVEASVNTNYHGRVYTTRPQPEDPSSVDTSDEDQQKAPMSGRASAVTEHGRYNSSGGELVLRMPILRPAMILQKRQSALEWEQASYRYEAARQQMMFKVVDAWLELHAARQELRLAEQQVRVNERQMAMVRRGTELGSFSVPQEDEAASRLAASQADALAARSTLGLKRLALEHLTGVSLDMATLMADLPVTSTEGVSRQSMSTLLPAQGQVSALETLLSAAELGNPNIRAAELALQATRQSVKQAEMAHWPTLDLKAALERNSQGLGTSAGQPGFRSTQATIGVDLRIPIFSGGSDAARIREAAAQLEGAEHERESARRQVQAEVHQAWYQLQVSEAKVESARLARRAAASMTAQATKGIETGAKSELDLLQAQAQAQTALRDWLRARYDQVRSVVQLRALLGDLALDQMAQVEAGVIGIPAAAVKAASTGVVN